MLINKGDLTMQNAGGNDFSLNQFEYCYLVEDTDPCATEMKIYVPKLMGQKTGSANTNKASVDQTSFMNSSDCKLELLLKCNLLITL